jgi:hypothetical protein
MVDTAKPFRRSLSVPLERLQKLVALPFRNAVLHEHMHRMLTVALVQRAQTAIQSNAWYLADRTFLPISEC